METKVKVAIPQPSIDFNFHSNCSSPYITAPSSPQPFSTTSSSLQPNENFEFNFTGQLQRPSISADELFHAGKILPLNLIQEPASPKQQHKIQKQRSSSFSVPSIEKSKTRSESSDSDDVFSNENIKTTSSSSFSSFFSFSKGYRKWRLKDFLLFRSVSEGRGRERKRYTVLCKTTAYDDVNSSSFRSIENSGSVSKNRVPVSAHEFHYTLNPDASEELKRKAMLCKTTAYDDVNNSSFRSIENSGSVSKRRGPVSAHELHYTLNRAVSEEFKKKTMLCKTTANDDVNNSSFRSIENSGSVSKRRGPVSAHELHYTLNRAASEELKRKTMLPYKQGLLGCLGLNHGASILSKKNHGASMHSISRRFGSMERA